MYGPTAAYVSDSNYFLQNVSIPLVFSLRRRLQYT